MTRPITAVKWNQTAAAFAEYFARLQGSVCNILVFGARTTFLSPKRGKKWKIQNNFGDTCDEDKGTATPLRKHFANFDSIVLKAGCSGLIDTLHVFFFNENGKRVCHHRLLQTCDVVPCMTWILWGEMWKFRQCKRQKKTMTGDRCETNNKLLECNFSNVNPPQKKNILHNHFPQRWYAPGPCWVLGYDQHDTWWLACWPVRWRTHCRQPPQLRHA